MYPINMIITIIIIMTINHIIIMTITMIIIMNYPIKMINLHLKIILIED